MREAAASHGMGIRRQQQRQCVGTLVAVVLTVRSSTAFVQVWRSSTATPLSYRAPAGATDTSSSCRHRPSSARVVTTLRIAPSEDEAKMSVNKSDDEEGGEELWGLNDFYIQKAERDRQNGGIPEAAAEFLKSGAPVGDITALRAALKTERDRLDTEEGLDKDDKRGSAANSSTEDSESSGVDEATAAAIAAVAAAGVAPAASSSEGLGLEGGIFPSDVSPSSADKDITLMGARLDPGQPDAMVGFWQLYGSTGNRENVSGRIILRADGQVVGGPAVRKTPEVKWSDEEGLKPVGGKWEVYLDEETSRTRLRFTISLSFQSKNQLEMDGTVMMVEGWDDILGRNELQPQVFGAVEKRSGGEMMTGKAGDFSMMKTASGEDDVFVATVGSQSQRMW